MVRAMTEESFSCGHGQEAKVKTSVSDLVRRDTSGRT
jgi:hypothetical protein